MGSPIRVNYSGLDVARYQRLTLDQCQALHEASLEIMERIGLRFDDEEAVAMLKKAGAWVSDENVVHMPQRLVDWALGVAPKTVLLYDQTGSNPLKLGWRKSHYGPVTDTLFVCDRLTDHRRLATLQDLIECTQVCHALPNIDFLMSMFSVSDRPAHSVDVHQVRVLMEHSTKPVVFCNYSADTTRYVIALAQAIAGGPEHLRYRPFLVDYVNVSSPLVHNVDAIRRTFQSVDAGIPILYRPSLVTRGLTTPLTMASFVTLNNVGSLAGLVLTQLRREGAPFIREGGPAGTVDQRHMVGCYGRPEGRGFQADMGQLYNLPTFGLAGGSDSKLPDGQAVAEMALTLTLEALSGNSLVHGIAALEGAKAASIELLVIADEIIGWLRAAVQGLEISQETLALDVIEEVGLENLYVSTEHTLRHCRDDWRPALFDCRRYDSWQQAGELSLIDRAKARVADIVANSPGPRSFPPKVRARMDSIVLEADRRAGNSSRTT